MAIGPNDKVYSVLRSIFRYGKLKEMAAPDILIESEQNMMAAALKKLNSDDIFEMVTSWSDFHKEQSVEDELQNKRLEDDLNQMYATLN